MSEAVDARCEMCKSTKAAYCDECAVAVFATRTHSSVDVFVNGVHRTYFCADGVTRAMTVCCYFGHQDWVLRDADGKRLGHHEIVDGCSAPFFLDPPEGTGA